MLTTLLPFRVFFCLMAFEWYAAADSGLLHNLFAGAGAAVSRVASGRDAAGADWMPRLGMWSHALAAGYSSQESSKVMPSASAAAGPRSIMPATGYAQ